MNLKDIPVLCALSNIYDLFVPAEEPKRPLPAPVVTPSLPRLPARKEEDAGEIHALKNTIAIQQIAIEKLKHSVSSVANCSSIDELYAELDVMGNTEIRLLDQEQQNAEKVVARPRQVHRRDTNKITQEDARIIMEERAAYEQMRQQYREGSISEARTFPEMGELINKRLGYNKNPGTYVSYWNGTYPLESLPTRAELAGESEKPTPLLF